MAANKEYDLKFPEQIRIYVSAEMAEDLHFLNYKTRRSISDLAREALAPYIDAEKAKLKG